MAKIHRIEKVYSVFFILTLIENVIACGFLAAIPADNNTALLFGFSFRRLLLLGLLLLLGAIPISGLIMVKSNQNKFYSIHKKLAESPQMVADLFMLVSFVLFVSTSFFFAPREYYGWFLPFYERLLPLMIFLALSTAQYLLVMIITLKKKPGLKLKDLVDQNSNGLKASGIILGIFLLLWLLIAVSGLGIRQPESLWAEGGVPILPGTVYISGGVLLFISYPCGRLLNKKSK